MNPLGVDLGILKELPAYAVLIWLVIVHEKRSNSKMDEIAKLLGRSTAIIERLESRLRIFPQITEDQNGSQ